MLAEKTYRLPWTAAITAKLADYIELVKLRLSILVVISSVFGYFLATVNGVNWLHLIFLITGGFLVTGASNMLNQILEKDLDKKMDRTRNRPLPANRMSVGEALTASMVMGAAGVFVLWIGLNPLTGLLGLISMLLYAFAYTPLKSKSAIAVFVGAIPGAMPPLIGWVAATGSIEMAAWVLFFIQFIWQFPHFWAIAWVLDDDYKKAGFRLLPSKGGRTKFSAFQILIYAAMLIPISLLPFYFELSGWISACIAIAMGLIFAVQGVLLLKKCTVKTAAHMMLGSFIYLPVVQLAFVLDKLSYNI